jgi:uncharacterized zinc-type alcohol dehydrogenase-like protein
MITAKAWAAKTAKAPLEPYSFERREVGEHDVLIDIAYCGICHSDIHQARDEWGGSTFPMVPGHEIAGHVVEVGSGVKKFKAGDKVGVGCLVNSCRNCSSCKDGLEQFCEGGMVLTYNSLEKDGKTATQGGYADKIVVHQDFVLKMPEGIPLEQAAPLLCAGITTYSPLKHWQLKSGQRLGVLGLGGLGHMAVKIGAAMGAEVVVFSSSDRKKADAARLGATHFVAGLSAADAEKYAGSCDLIINTVSADIDLAGYLGLLKRDGTMIWVGAPEKPSQVPSMPLIFGRRSLAGSLIGGLPETQEMLDFCGEKGIGSDVEVIRVDQINEAYERVMRGDVRYRFVIDLKSLGN